jgi:uncharacterized membrane protein (DUF485 family)
MKLAKAIVNLAKKTDKLITPLGFICMAFYLIAIKSPAYKEILMGQAIGFAIVTLVFLLLGLVSAAIRAYGPDIE